MKTKFRNLCLIGVCAISIWCGLHFWQEATGVSSSEAVAHTITRLSFGIKPGQISQVHASGLENYIQSQLNPTSLPETDILKNQLKQFETISNSSSNQLWQEFRRYNQKIVAKGENALSIQEKKRLQVARDRFKSSVAKESKQAHIARAVFSSHQLQEVMTDFWFNHFSVFVNKRSVGLWVNDYENQIRDHALGSFRDLLEVTAHHPAMLMYLDNDLNTNPQSKSKSGIARGLNENYARELM